MFCYLPFFTLQAEQTSLTSEHSVRKCAAFFTNVLYQQGEAGRAAQYNGGIEALI